MNLDPYFARIGWTGSRAPTLETLKGLCLRHTAGVPFENLDILLGQRISLDLASLEDKIVAHRRGGYCFEQNTLFATVLEELGFCVTTLGGRVRLGVPPATVSARSHMLLRVDLPEGPHLVDVGFTFTPTAPLLLKAGPEQALHANTYRLTRDAAFWTLEIQMAEGFTPAYVFTEEALYPIDYEVANYYTSTHPGSHFMAGPLVVRHDPENGARFVLRGREWSLRRGLEVETHPIASPEEALSVLAEQFRLPFPKETRFRGLE
jgi:N-hydroxyarylamine O-acetyltransferase